MLNSNEHEIVTAHKKLKYRQIKKFLALSLSDGVFILLKNVKMPTIVGILTFMSRINFVHSWVEYEKKVDNLRAGCNFQINLNNYINPFYSVKSEDPDKIMHGSRKVLIIYNDFYSYFSH